MTKKFRKSTKTAEPTKFDIIRMLRRKTGAQRHCVQGLKTEKLGLEVISTKDEGKDRHNFERKAL
ncbi:MAG TPA: hypothetical protein VM144_10225 [Aestuariivirga sp.]|nr:hypothetical protein [Aestuariivirga sp.]